ncbi:MAG: UvrD-helicase domain-containing protein [Firmicutes bacterium]|nr:UvrD-helicase domain-containing protein [Bacillota bacterium]
MASKILDKLNNEQQKPLLAVDGAVLVTAGAGSGKTRMLTHRIAYLIEQGVSDYNILAITFTNKATNEIRERINSLVAGSSGVTISTFHSLCVKILRSHIEKLNTLSLRVGAKRTTMVDGHTVTDTIVGQSALANEAIPSIEYTSSFSIYADDERKKVLKQVYEELGVEDEALKKSIDYHISNSKNNNMNYSEYGYEYQEARDIDTIMQAYRLYDKKLLESNALDFDDLLVKCYQLFVKCPEVLEYYANKYQYIHVDEFQDTNIVQYDILKLLASKHGNILVVGDEDQSIYGWRGANIKNISNFVRDFPGVQLFKLEQNYRSSKTIISAANKVIANNSERLLKTLWTNNPEGEDIIYQALDSDREEADFIVRNIYRLVNDHGYKYSDIAILMRYAAPSRLVEERLVNYNMPYVMLGGFKFFERSEIKTALGYIRAIVNPADNESFTRIINNPKRGIGETTVAKLASGGSVLSAINNVQNNDRLNSGAKNKVAEFAVIYNKLVSLSKELGIVEFVEKLISLAGFRTAFNTGLEEDYARVKNLDALIDSVADFAGSNPDATLSEYLESVTLISDIDSVAEDNNNILLSTVHAVKGLEFKVVFIIALEDGIFPIVRFGGDRPTDMEEERRLMYVAMTRAKERLYLTRARNRYLYNEGVCQPASRFLKEMEMEMSSGVRAMPRDFARAAEAGPAITLPKISAEDYGLYKAGVMVGHPKFGLGTITDDSKLASKIVTVDFGGFGVKTLSLDFAPLTIIKKKKEV